MTPEQLKDRLTNAIASEMANVTEQGGRTSNEYHVGVRCDKDSIQAVAVRVARFVAANPRSASPMISVREGNAVSIHIKPRAA